MPGIDYVLAINVHIYRSIVPGRASGYVPGMLAAYENQGCFPLCQTDRSEISGDF